MSEIASLLHVRQSVFAKLVAIMLAMAAIILALIVAFFLLYLGPVMNASIDGVVHEYMHTLAATTPSYERAKEIGERLNVQTRYEGLTARGPRLPICRRLPRRGVTGTARSPVGITS
jgi:hypothetical protein